MLTKIYYKKVRNFGEVFGATFSYIRQNFKSFFGAVLAMAGPFFLISNIASSYLIKYSFGNMVNTNGVGYMLSNMMGPLATAVFLSLIGVSVYLTVVNEHILINEELGEEEKPKLAQIASRFFGSYWRTLGNMLMLVLMGVLCYLIFALLIGLFVLGLSGGGFVMVMIMMLLLIAVLFIVMPIVFYIMTAILFTSQRHKMGFFKACRKVLKYLRNNFWLTWLTSFCGGIVSYFLMMIAYIPVLIITMITAFSRINMETGAMTAESETPIYLIIVTSVVSMLVICVNTVYLVMMSLQCASNEERFEGKSILEKIDSL